MNKLSVASCLPFALHDSLDRAKLGKALGLIGVTNPRNASTICMTLSKVVAMGKHLEYDISEDEWVVIKLMHELGNTFEFKEGMKVRAMYMEVKVWFYGRVRSITHEKFISLKVERSKPYMLRAFRTCPPTFLTKGSPEAWVEPYDY